MRSYAIGDIHGHLDLLLGAHALIAADRAATVDTAAPVVHIGDLVDRGPDSRGVIEHLMHGQAVGEPWVVLKGNHDRMFTLYLDDAIDPRLRAELSWLHPRIGGVQTLESYGIRSPGDRPLAPVLAEAQAAVPEAHRRWLEGLPGMFTHGEAVFTHAGIRPGVALADQSEDDLCWIRHEFLDDQRDHGALVVHGHTAIDHATHYGNRVNIDSSAAYGGPLTVVVIEGRQVWQLTGQGRVALVPQPRG
jgi:serine/threonine protein phosphatase 1